MHSEKWTIIVGRASLGNGRNVGKLLNIFVVILFTMKTIVQCLLGLSDFFDSIVNLLFIRKS